MFATRLTRLTRALQLAQPRARDPERGGRRSRLVERHPDRRRPEGVQRSPRPSGHRSRRGRRDPLRRLGARRPDARRQGDGAPGPPGSPDRVGQSPRRRRGFRASRRRDGRGAPVLRRAGQRPQPRGARRGRRGDRGRRARVPERPTPAPAPAEPEEEPWASATPVQGSSVAMPSGYGPKRGHTTPGWSIGGS